MTRGRWASQTDRPRRAPTASEQGLTIAKEILPLPDSTYQLLLDAAARWPDHVATQWIPDPTWVGECRSWTYAELAATVTRAANALTAVGVGGQDAVILLGVNTGSLHVATLAAQAVGVVAPVNSTLNPEHIVEIIRRTGSRVLVAAGPRCTPSCGRAPCVPRPGSGCPPCSRCGPMTRPVSRRPWSLRARA